MGLNAESQEVAYVAWTFVFCTGIHSDGYQSGN